MEKLETEIKGWVVRNKEGDLHAFLTNNPPILDEDYWVTCEDGDVLCLPNDMFPMIKWGYQPIEIVLTITPIINGTESRMD